MCPQITGKDDTVTISESRLILRKPLSSSLTLSLPICYWQIWCRNFLGYYKGKVLSLCRNVGQSQNTNEWNISRLWLATKLQLRNILLSVRYHNIPDFSQTFLLHNTLPNLVQNRRKCFRQAFCQIIKT